MFNALFKCSMHCFTCSMHCFTYSMHCFTCSMHCFTYSMHCFTCSMHCFTCSMHCFACSMHCFLPVTDYAVCSHFHCCSSASHSREANMRFVSSNWFCDKLSYTEGVSSIILLFWARQYYDTVTLNLSATELDTFILGDNNNTEYDSIVMRVYWMSQYYVFF